MLNSLECNILSVSTSYELKRSVNLARSVNIRKLAVCYNQYKQHNTEKNVFLLFSCLFSSFFFLPLPSTAQYIQFTIEKKEMMAYKKEKICDLKFIQCLLSICFCFARYPSLLFSNREWKSVTTNDKKKMKMEWTKAQNKKRKFDVVSSSDFL